MNKRHYEHTLPNIRGSLSNTYSSIKMNLISNTTNTKVCLSDCRERMSMNCFLDKNNHVPETTSGTSFSPSPREQRAGPDDPTHTATVKPLKISAYEIYKNVPECGVFHRQGFFS